MQINIFKLIRNSLITFTRDIKIVELIRVITSQAEVTFNEFNLLVPDWKYKINANSSVLSLQHHIKRELDVDAVITELDGKPIDFLVTITGFVDENRLRVLINDYKLAGKSYVFKVGSVVYSAVFTNYLCEDIIEIFTANFTDYICESDGIITIESEAYFYTDGKWHVSLRSSSNVQSTIHVSGAVLLTTSGAPYPVPFAGDILVGTSRTDVIIGTYSDALTMSASINVITPSSDDYYEYLIK